MVILSVIQSDMIHSQEKCQNTNRSLYQHEIMSEKCSDSHLQSYRNQGDVLNFLSQQSEYWPIKWVEIIHCRAKAWPSLVFYARIIADWITQSEIANMFSWITSNKWIMETTNNWKLMSSDSQSSFFSGPPLLTGKNQFRSIHVRLAGILMGPAIPGNTITFKKCF